MHLRGENMDNIPADKGSFSIWSIPYIALRVGFMAGLGGVGFVLVLNWVTVWNLTPVTRVEMFLLGAGCLFLLWRMWRPTGDIIKGRQGVKTSDNIGAVIILCVGFMMAAILYNSRNYFFGGMKAQRAAIAVMKAQIPDFERWDALSLEERKNALPALIAFLGHEDRAVRNNAARCIGTIGEAAAQAIPALTAYMEKEQCVPSAAAGALARLGPQGEAVLRTQMESKDLLVRDAATFALKGKL